MHSLGAEARPTAGCVKTALGAMLEIEGACLERAWDDERDDAWTATITVALLLASVRRACESVCAEEHTSCGFPRS